MKAACIQLCSGAHIEANLDAAGHLIREAAGRGAAFIATPEMTHILQRSPKLLFAAIEREEDDKGVGYFGRLAKELSVTLLIGSLAIKISKDRAVNRSFLFSPSGQIAAKYDKIHLFDVHVSKAETWTESRIYDRGKTGAVAQVGNMSVGLSICYDLRFPHLYRLYAQQGVDIMTVPAAFTKPTGDAHWETLLRARAIETGAYVLAPAQGGQHEDGRATWGRSMIVDPWGKVLSKRDHDRPGIIYADIDVNEVKKARRKIPAWQHEPGFTV